MWPTSWRLCNINPVAPRGARYMFEARCHRVPEVVRKPHEADKLSKVPGRRARAIANISNAAEGLGDDYKGSLRPNTAA